MLHGKYTLFIDQYGNRWEARTVSELRDKIGGGGFQRCTLMIGRETAIILAAIGVRLMCQFGFYNENRRSWIQNNLYCA